MSMGNSVLRFQVYYLNKLLTNLTKLFQLFLCTILHESLNFLMKLMFLNDKIMRLFSFVAKHA